MGVGKDFFDALDHDSAFELPTNGERTDTRIPSVGEIEMINRLMCIIKCALNDGMLSLRATPTAAGGEYVAVSKSFEEFTGYTAETHPGSDIYAEESRPVAQEHGEYNLAGPYIAKLVKLDTSEVWMIIHGMSWIYQNVTWRVIHYEEYEG
jgi:hypothetical protein